VHPHSLHGSLDPTNSVSQTAFRLVEPFLHSSHQTEESLYFTLGHHFFPSELCLCMGDLDPHSIHGSLSPLESTSRMASGWFIHFCMAQDCDTLIDGQTTIDLLIELRFLYPT